MVTPMADLHRLTLLIQRLLDAELLQEEDGAALLAEADAARQSLEAGDGEAVCRHIERLAQRAEALVLNDVLDRTYGRIVIEIARRITAEGAG